MQKKLLSRFIATVIIAALSFIIIYKAATVPATFDEVTTVRTYTGFSRIPDAILNTGGNSNNHILNSLLITLSDGLFDIKLWSIRLPNVLSFFLLSATLFLLAEVFFDSTVLLFCLPFVCLLLNPYLIDFFGLARGYAMASAFMAASITCLLIFSESKKIKWYYLAILFSTLAAYANFIFLIYWVAVHLLLIVNLFLQKQDRRRITNILAITFFAGTAFMALCYIPVTGIQQCIRSAPGITTNFYHETFISQINRFNYGNPSCGLSEGALAQILNGILVLAALNCFLKFRKNIVACFSDPFSQVFLLLILVCTLNIFQVNFFHTDHLYARTALIYYTLFIFVFIFLLRDLAVSKALIGQGVIALTSVFFILHFAFTVNLKSVYEWSYDAFTNEVMAYINEYKEHHPEVKVTDLNLTECFRYSFTFYRLNNEEYFFSIKEPEGGALPRSGVDTTSTTLFYYSADTNVTALKNYVVVKKFIATGLMVPFDGARPEQFLLIHKPQ